MKHGIDQQIYYEDEGAAAALSGKARNDCPYSRDANSFEWNHWTFGHDIATSEQNIIKSNFVTFTSTAKDGWKYPSKIPLDEAVKSGMWKPRYARLTQRSS